MKIILLATLITLPAFAKVTFSQARIYVPLKGSSMTAGYVVVENDSDKNVALKLKAVSPFKTVETHETIDKNAMATMQKIETFTVPAKGRLELKPGGNHMMLFDPSRELKTNEELKAQFSVDGLVEEVTFKVVSR